MLLARVGRTVAAILVALLVGTLVSATLVRIAPGFDSDERALDSRLSPESQAAVRAERAANRNVLTFYTRYLTQAIHGDFGVSQSLGRPVSELIRDRLPVTLRLAAWG